jgi:hypothetical protein
LRSDPGGDLANRRIDTAARFCDLSRCDLDIGDLREAGLGD